MTLPPHSPPPIHNCPCKRACAWTGWIYEWMCVYEWIHIYEWMCVVHYIDTEEVATTKTAKWCFAKAQTLILNERLSVILCLVTLAYKHSLSVLDNNSSLYTYKFNFNCWRYQYSEHDYCNNIPINTTNQSATQDEAERVSQVKMLQYPCIHDHQLITLHNKFTQQNVTYMDATDKQTECYNKQKTAKKNVSH